MDFMYVVVLSSLLYILITRFIRKKLIDMDKVKEFQNRMNELNKKFREAVKRNDKEEMERLNKEQMKLMPKMKWVMLEQLKMTFFILIIFFAFMFLLNSIDPLKSDDVVLNFTRLNDSAWQTSFEMRGEVANVHIEFEDVKGNKNKVDVFVSTKYEMKNFTAGDSIFYTDKEKYKEGEEVKLYALNVKKINKAIYDNGSALNINLPFNLLGIRFIHGTYGVFIFTSVILGWILTPLINKL